MTQEPDDWTSLGGAIRSRRRARSLTMVELARRCALSQPFLSQVENGRARPSMESLLRIARALGTTPQALFTGDPTAGTSPTVVRRHVPGRSTVPVLDRGVASAVRLLLPGDAPFHVMEFDGLPTDFLEMWQHDGFEAVYVLEGEVEVEIDGDVTTLGTGDFLSYPSNLPHRHRSPLSSPARVLMIETGARVHAEHA